jgi:hypothetical protein
MKFGKDFWNHLQEALLAWMDKYLTYKALKKLIKRLPLAYVPPPPPPPGPPLPAPLLARGRVSGKGTSPSGTGWPASSTWCPRNSTISTWRSGTSSAYRYAPLPPLPSDDSELLGCVIQQHEFML